MPLPFVSPLQTGLWMHCVRISLSVDSETIGSYPPPGLGIRILPHLEKSKRNLNLVDDAPSLDIVPWKLSVPTVRFHLASLKKDTTNPEIYKQLYLQLIYEYPLSEKKNHQQF